MLPAAHDDPFAQFKVTFFEECSELLADMEQHLGDLEAGSYENETLHAIFRAVHSIKAGAGAFSFARLVNFSHKFEYLLDELRTGKLTVEAELIETLFRGFDVLSDLIGFAQNGEVPDDAYGQGALDQISFYLNKEDASEAGEKGQTASSAGDAPDDSGAAAEPTAEAPAAAKQSLEHFRIEFTPREAMYRHANEPLLIIRELKDLGRTETTIDISRLPALNAMEPEDAYFSWVFDLWTEYGRDEIDEVFEFVVDDCDLTIVTLDHDDEVVDVEVSPGRPVGENEGFGLYVSPEDLVAGQVSASQAAEALKRQMASKIVPPETANNKQEQVEAAGTGPSAAPKASSIRVDVDRVDRLVNMVGELVITQSMLAQEVENSDIPKTDRVFTGMDELSTHIRDLQEDVMSIRMQPVKSVFSRMPRIVRDVSKKLGKKVRLVTVGEATEVDKTVIEELADPLTHMIRNSLDHGLESPEERLAAGKADEGTIRLSAEHRGGRIVIEIVDDGRGINREKVLKLAREKGVVAPDTTLSDSEVDNLIFAPGFSTADEVTDLSGRGVGMDVVLRNIQSLGGRVSVQSQPGAGTRFQLTLPLTLAVLDGMIVGVAGQKFVVPISSILETVRPPAADVQRMVDGSCLVRIRGEYVPVVPVARVFNFKGGEQDPSEGLVVLAETDGGRVVGLLVDELAGQQQVVIKSLESNYKSVRGIASATILGNGSVCLILDVDALAKMPVLMPAGKSGSKTQKAIAAQVAAE